MGGYRLKPAGGILSAQSRGGTIEGEDDISGQSGMLSPQDVSGGGLTRGDLSRGGLSRGRVSVGGVSPRSPKSLHASLEEQQKLWEYLGSELDNLADLQEAEVTSHLEKLKIPPTPPRTPTRLTPPNPHPSHRQTLSNLSLSVSLNSMSTLSHSLQPPPMPTPYIPG